MIITGGVLSSDTSPKALTFAPIVLTLLLFFARQGLADITMEFFGICSATRTPQTRFSKHLPTLGRKVAMTSMILEDPRTVPSMDAEKRVLGFEDEGRSVSSELQRGAESPLLEEPYDVTNITAIGRRRRRVRILIGTLTIAGIAVVALGIICVIAWSPRWPRSRTGLFDVITQETEPSTVVKGSQKGHLSLLKPGELGRPSVKDPSTTRYLLKNPCGDTAAEARARGCHFEILNWSWLPNECHDHELEESFTQIKDWEFWQNQNKTGRISVEEARQGEYDMVWVEWDYHVQHCVNMWRKLHRALAGSGFSAVDSVSAQWFHTDHCASAVVDRRSPSDLVNTIIYRKFPDCGVAEWKLRT